MNQNSSLRLHQLALKAANALIPGYGELGSQFGRLVPTPEILAGIRPQRQRKHDGPNRELSPGWLEKLLGFRSIATTHATQAAASHAIASGLDWPEIGIALRRPPHNPDLDKMLGLSVQSAVRAYAANRSGFDPAHSIAGHIHIASTTNVRTPYALLEARETGECQKTGLPILTLLSGCSGLLVAIQHARMMLVDDIALRDDNAFVLITASNDLLPFAHTRGRCPASQNDNIDDWLFQAIFGEGVGAIVIGHANRGGDDWIVEDVNWQAVTRDWRVTMSPPQSTDSMLIRARQVSATFREHVPRVMQDGLDALGLSVDDVHRLCIHESNPNLVAQVTAQLGAPSGRVHSISADVGTLAGVSAFSLLDEAFRSFRANPDCTRGSVVCALIGEAGKGVVAGHLALRHHSAIARPSRSESNDTTVAQLDATA